MAEWESWKAEASCCESMSKILISYRREDSADVTGRIYDRLVQQFGREAVFKDNDSIPLGVDFRKYLDEQVAQCDVFLAVIGRNWLKGKSRKGTSRLDDPSDFVRIEIESALKRQIPVIPVFVQGAKIPEVERLPTSIQDLPYRNGIVVRPDPDFHKDMDRLVQRLTQPARGSEPQTTPHTQSQPVVSEIRQITPTAPVDMVKVPKGSFRYGADNTLVVIGYDYWIDKYPVTNEKYRAFVQAGGYENKQYWPNGFNLPSPGYFCEWNKVDKAEHPVVGVSYYEAEAYAKWAGKRLPTEQEWEKAARGTDGRKYPWGEEFDEKRCNHMSMGIFSSAFTFMRSVTTPVTQFPDGVSPYGCYDMVGNAFEWCSSRYLNILSNMVLRGGFSPIGMYHIKQTNLSAWNRIGYPPNERKSGLFGFRLVQDIS